MDSHEKETENPVGKGNERHGNAPTETLAESSPKTPVAPATGQAAERPVDQPDTSTGRTVSSRDVARETTSQSFQPAPAAPQVDVDMTITDSRSSNDRQWRFSLFLEAIAAGAISSLLTILIQWLLAWLVGFLWIWEMVLLTLGLMTLFAAIYVWVRKKDDPGWRRIVGVMSVLGTALVLVVGITLFRPGVAHQWDFEPAPQPGGVRGSGVGTDWGVYDEPMGRIQQGPAVAVKEVDFARSGRYCLEVAGDGIETTSDAGKPALKRWPAVQYPGELKKSRVTAFVYLPRDARSHYRYADAKFFLFAGGWNWEDSGSGQCNQGVALSPGHWVKVSWDLRPHRTAGWAEPWPWEHILGIQLYIEGSQGGTVYDGPIYIDDVTVYRR